MAVAPLSTATARTYHKTWPTDSRPVLLECSDGRLYVVKGRQNRRVLINDHLVARFGGLIGAPVTSAAFIDLPQALIDVEPQLANMPSGICHGSLWLADCSERLSFAHANVGENRHRFAGLAILYSWMGCWTDHQFIYKKTSPQHVYSVDHGHFFPSGPHWTIATLQGAPAAVLDPVFSVCGLTGVELRKAAHSFQAIDAADVGDILRGVPASWGITENERSAMTTYLLKRRSELIKLL